MVLPPRSARAKADLSHFCRNRNTRAVTSSASATTTSCPAPGTSIVSMSGMGAPTRLLASRPAMQLRHRASAGSAGGARGRNGSFWPFREIVHRAVASRSERLAATALPVTVRYGRNLPYGINTPLSHTRKAQMYWIGNSKPPFLGSGACTLKLLSHPLFPTMAGFSFSIIEPKRVSELTALSPPLNHCHGSSFSPVCGSKNW